MDRGVLSLLGDTASFRGRRISIFFRENGKSGIVSLANKNMAFFVVSIDYNILSVLCPPHGIPAQWPAVERAVQNPLF